MRLVWFGVGWLCLVAYAPVGAAQCDCGDMDHNSPGDALRATGEAVVTSPITWGLAGLGVLGLAAWAWRAGWLPRAAGVLVLWSRFNADDLDDHPTRSRLLDLLRAHAGAATNDLAELSELNRATLLYHLEILGRFGLVNSQRVGRERAWYLTRGAKPDLRRVATLAVPARQRLFDLIERSPGCSQADLARETGLSAATIHHHLQALRAAGLVELRREGARVLCFPVPADRYGATTPAYRAAAPA